MLDLDRLERIRLSARPRGQILLGGVGLALDYRLKPTEILIEGALDIPERGGAFLAMNHTDRYNYFPFQYKMWRLGLPFTATWVKGKYYEHRLIGAFMDSMNNIPLPSRGYVIATEFRKHTRRPPSDDEYRLLRDLVDDKRSPEEVLEASQQSAPDVARFLAADGRIESVRARVQAFDELFDRMLGRVVELNRIAIEELGLNVLVFPEGTRSLRLLPGLTGLAQISQYLGAPIVPVGCSGSDKLYPGDAPFSQGGRVVYRVGKPLEVDGPELAPYRVPRDALPFGKQASRLHGDRYAAIMRVVMERIAELVDEEYRPAPDHGPAERGVRRFL